MNVPLHSALVKNDWIQYIELLRDAQPVSIDGRNLTIAKVVAIARNGNSTSLAESAHKRLEAATEAIEKSLRSNEIIYGLNTGFGGSADTRTDNLEELQRVLVRELHYGVLATSLPSSVKRPQNSEYPQSVRSRLFTSLANEDLSSASCMPKPWTRATIAIRMNSLASGNSGVRLQVLDRMRDLLHYDIVPHVPMRGSISASGDLSPLSYVSGTLQAKASLQVWEGPGAIVTTASSAFTRHNIAPIKMATKEALAIVNGTATSCAVAVLALHDMNLLAILAQILTAMSVEGLRGSSESFHPLFAACRPHPGQEDAARNIRSFLAGSKLVRDDDDETSSLRQDRYSIRTAAQWIGPSLEDLNLARTQLLMECNSVTDNPIIDFQDSGKALHGGNFQAMAVTSAMEKTRNAAFSIGRMLFTQVTELINPVTNRGLPPNLVADEPSLSFIMKAVDLQSAALTSELGYLAHTVNNVQTAEQGNQSLNSLALISARYTHVAADVLSIEAAGHLLAACQALDLRALLAQFFQTLEEPFHNLNEQTWYDQQSPYSVQSKKVLWVKLRQLFDGSSHMNLTPRMRFVASELRSTLFDVAVSSARRPTSDRLSGWVDELAALLEQTWTNVRDAYFVQGDAGPFLGVGSKQMYYFVRRELNVPFLHSAILRSRDPLADGIGHSAGALEEALDPLTVGGYITRVYEAIRNGVLFEAVMGSIGEPAKGEITE